MARGVLDRSAPSAAVMALWCSLAACAEKEAPAAGSGDLVSSPPGAVADPSPSASAPDARPLLPRPHRARLGAAVSLDATCVACHAREAAEWRGSLHHGSSTEAAYRRAFAVEPSAFCRGCHAPEADPRLPPPAAVTNLGVGCVTCHVTTGDGAVLASTFAAGDNHAEGRDEGSAAPHAVVRSDDFAASGGCAGCHEFRFPSAMSLDDDDGDFMQTTAREHERSPERGTPCAGCHMPRIAGRRSHAFAQVRDPAWLRERLRATAAWIDDHQVRVTLEQRAAGHASPTGDLFRRLEVGCELRDAGGRVLGRQVRYLARHFEMVPGKAGRQLVRDDRLSGEPASIDFTWDPRSPRAATATWWVSYQRVETVGRGTAAAEAMAKVESEVRLHDGALARPGYAAP